MMMSRDRLWCKKLYSAFDTPNMSSAFRQYYKNY